MSPADERRRLVQAAQRREPYMSDEWFGHEPGLRSSLYPVAPPKRRGWTFLAVSAGLVVAALGTCWALASADSIAQWTQGAPDHAGTTEVTSAPTTATEVAALPNVVPTTVQPAVVPPAPPPIATQPAVAMQPQPAVAMQPAPTPVVAPPAPQPVVETAPKLAPAAAPAAAPSPVESLPAAAQRGPHHEPAGNTTLHVVETPEPVEPSSNE